jgi:ABC-type bacteriocin/lantibiotic exporter with double-glycine peptidase domain
MGSSALIGLAAVLVFFPIQHFSEKAVVTAQDGLMKARDERTALMNEVLNGIRMLKFMAWERPFEKRIHTIRAKELGWQKRDYIIQIGFGVLWSVTPIVGEFALISFSLSGVE